MLFLTVGGYISTGSTPLICLLKEYRGVEVLNGELRVGEDGLYLLIGMLIEGEKVSQSQFTIIKNKTLDYGHSLGSFAAFFMSVIVRIPFFPKAVAEKISKYRLRFRGYNKQVFGYDEIFKFLFEELECVNNNLEVLTRKERIANLSKCFSKALASIKDKNITNNNNLMIIDQLMSPKVLFYRENHLPVSMLLPDAKIIIVKRDPRDQYIDFIQKRKKEYHLMSHQDSLNAYITEFKVRYDRMCAMIECYDLKNVLFVWFEDLVENYDEENFKISEFVGLHDHDNKFKYFYPGQAKSHIKMYTSYKYQDDIAKIETEMYDHLYKTNT